MGDFKETRTFIFWEKTINGQPDRHRTDSDPVAIVKTGGVRRYFRDASNRPDSERDDREESFIGMRVLCHQKPN